MNFNSNEFRNEYSALTEDCGSVLLTDWTSVSITGEDRSAFLHNMCTNDIRRLAPGAGCEAFCTDVKGKIIAHVFAIAQEDQLILLTVPNLAMQIIDHLGRYVIREDVQLTDETDQYGLLLISGANSPQLLAQLTNQNSLQLNTVWQSSSYSCGDYQNMLLRFDQVWPTSFLLRYHRNNKESIEGELATLGCFPCAMPAWTTLRVESALPLYGIDFDGSNLPQEVNRDQQAINLNKGCYLGQETVARIDALGHVNKKIVSLRFDSEDVPKPGAKLHGADQEVGEVTSAGWSPRIESPLALAMVRRGSNDVGCELESEHGKASVIQNEGRPLP